MKIYTIKISGESLSTHYYLREDAEEIANKLRKLAVVDCRVSLGAWKYELCKLISDQLDKIEIFEQIFLLKRSKRKPINNIFNVQIIEGDLI